MDRPIYVPPGGSPQVDRPDPEIFAVMGQENIFRMLEDFYEVLARSPIAAMFPRRADLRRQAAHKSAAFFVGLLGGPPLYQARYGSPMLRARHMPFSIDETARRVWLACFDEVLEQAASDYQFPPAHLAGFRRFLDSFSTWMVNTAPEPAAGDPDSPA